MKSKALIEKILKLKNEKNALILAHNYQRGEIQDIADFTGDSLGLSRTAAGTDADLIVFCGVRFMAETVKILSPDKTVLMPDPNAGCPMADMITREGLRPLKQKHPGATVVGYVNTPADVKTEIDICCTSSNVIRVIESLDEKQEIIFVPDKYLADYVSRKTGRELIAWNGYCPTHVKILPEDITGSRARHPEAVVIVHPECTPDVLNLADEVFSTDGMVKYANSAAAREIIVGTETGIIHRLKKENPCKEFYPASENAICPNMKLTTLEKVLWSLEDMKCEIILPREVLEGARKPVDRMVKLF